MKMLPALYFFGNHNLDFEKNDIYELEYYAISELRKIPIPDEILYFVYISIIKQFQGMDLSKLTEIENWCPISFRKEPGERDFPKEHVVSIGPMGLHLVITPHHIMLPAVVYERVDWYSPRNKDIVQIIRYYYHSIISHFSGDHALYVDERKTEKYYDYDILVNGSALIAFEQALITRYGIVRKPIFSYSYGKFPKYYIDTFADL
jgi:hypothetical protein